MPVLAITEIPLDTHDDFGKFRRLYCPDKTYLFCQSWVAVFTVINLAHAAADTDIEPHQLVSLDDCNQSQVLAVDIRSEERPVGQGWGSTCIYRGSQYNY